MRFGGRGCHPTPNRCLPGLTRAVSLPRLSVRGDSLQAIRVATSHERTTSCSRWPSGPARFQRSTSAMPAPVSASTTVTSMRCLAQAHHDGVGGRVRSHDELAGGDQIGCSSGRPVLHAVLAGRKPQPNSTLLVCRLERTHIARGRLHRRFRGRPQGVSKHHLNGDIHGGREGHLQFARVNRCAVAIRLGLLGGSSLDPFPGEALRPNIDPEPTVWRQTREVEPAVGIGRASFHRGWYRVSFVERLQRPPRYHVVDGDQRFAAADFETGAGNRIAMIIGDRPREMGGGRKVQVENDFIVRLVTAGRVPLIEFIRDISRPGPWKELLQWPPGKTKSLGDSDNLECPLISAYEAFDRQRNIAEFITAFRIRGRLGDTIVIGSLRGQINARTGNRPAA